MSKYMIQSFFTHVDVYGDKIRDVIAGISEEAMITDNDYDVYVSTGKGWKYKGSVKWDRAKEKMVKTWWMREA